MFEIPEWPRTALKSFRFDVCLTIQHELDRKGSGTYGEKMQARIVIVREMVAGIDNVQEVADSLGYENRV